MVKSAKIVESRKNLKIIRETIMRIEFEDLIGFEEYESLQDYEKALENLREDEYREISFTEGIPKQKIKQSKVYQKRLDRLFHGRFHGGHSFNHYILKLAEQDKLNRKKPLSPVTVEGYKKWEMERGIRIGYEVAFADFIGVPLELLLDPDVNIDHLRSIVQQQNQIARNAAEAKPETSLLRNPNGFIQLINKEKQIVEEDSTYDHRAEKYSFKDGEFHKLAVFLSNPDSARKNYNLGRDRDRALFLRFATDDQFEEDARLDALKYLSRCGGFTSEEFFKIEVSELKRWRAVFYDFFCTKFYASNSTFFSPEVWKHFLQLEMGDLNQLAVEFGSKYGPLKKMSKSRELLIEYICEGEFNRNETINALYCLIFNGWAESWEILAIFQSIEDDEMLLRLLKLLREFPYEISKFKIYSLGFAQMLFSSENEQIVQQAVDIFCQIVAFHTKANTLIFLASENFTKAQLIQMLRCIMQKDDQFSLCVLALMPKPIELFSEISNYLFSKINASMSALDKSIIFNILLHIKKVNNWSPWTTEKDNFADLVEKFRKSHTAKIRRSQYFENIFNRINKFSLWDCWHHVEDYVDFIKSRFLYRLELKSSKRLVNYPLKQIIQTDKLKQEEAEQRYLLEQEQIERQIEELESAFDNDFDLDDGFDALPQQQTDEDCSNEYVNPDLNTKEINELNTEVERLKKTDILEEAEIYPPMSHAWSFDQSLSMWDYNGYQFFKRYRRIEWYDRYSFQEMESEELKKYMAKIFF